MLERCRYSIISSSKSAATGDNGQGRDELDTDTGARRVAAWEQARRVGNAIHQAVNARDTMESNVKSNAHHR